MKYIRYTIITLFSLLILSGCNDEDDVVDIFVSGEWTMVNIYPAADLSITNRPYKPKYSKKDDLIAIGKIKVTFNEDNTINVTTSTQGVNGTWMADPKTREVDIKLKNKPNLSGIDKEFVNMLEVARIYVGDSKYLRLAPDKSNFIQLTHQH